jgi:hypothetical protein
MAIGGALGSGSTLVMQSFFQPEATLALYEAERVNVPMGWPHQWEQLAGAANWNEVDLSSLHHVGENSPLRNHPTVRHRLAGADADLWQHRDLHPEFRLRVRHPRGGSPGRARLSPAGQHIQDNRSLYRPDRADG